MISQTGLEGHSGLHSNNEKKTISRRTFLMGAAGLLATAAIGGGGGVAVAKLTRNSEKDSSSAHSSDAVEPTAEPTVEPTVATERTEASIIELKQNPDLFLGKINPNKIPNDYNDQRELVDSYVGLDETRDPDNFANAYATLFEGALNLGTKQDLINAKTSGMDPVELIVQKNAGYLGALFNEDPDTFSRVDRDELFSSLQYYADIDAPFAFIKESIRRFATNAGAYGDVGNPTLNTVNSVIAENARVQGNAVLFGATIKNTSDIDGNQPTTEVIEMTVGRLADIYSDLYVLRAPEKFEDITVRN